MINEDKLVAQLSSIAETFDLKIEDREALTQCKEMARAWNKCQYIHSYLEFLCKEGFERDIFDFSIWKLVCKNLDIADYTIRKYTCMETCRKEIEKWIKE